MNTNEYTTQVDAVAGMDLIEVSSHQALTLQNPEEWIRWGVLANPADSGEVVNPATSMSHGPVWQAINILAGDIGQLDFGVHRREGGSFTRDATHPVDWAISQQPNDFQTIDVWLETMIGWSLGWGNAISAIRRRGNEIELLPLLPERTKYEKVGQNEFVILSRLGDGQEFTAFDPSDTIHLRGLSANGFWGMSAVETCKNVIGHGLALMRHGNSVFRNSARPGGVIKAPQGVKVSKEARDNLREEWNQQHQGAGNTGNVAVLWQGLEWQQTTMSNEDAQWLAAVELDPVQVARLFMLPPYKLGYMKDSSVKANLEAQQREYFNTSLSRHASRIKHEIERKLFRESDRRGRKYVVKVDPSVLTQGTRKERVDLLSVAISSRLMTRNEGREELGLNPVEGGDVFENPAIDPVGSQADSEASNRATVNALTARGVGPLLKWERGRLIQGAKDRPSFVEWVVSFYDSYCEYAQSFLEPIMVLANVEGWTDALSDHACDMRERVLLMTDSTKPEDLIEAVCLISEEMLTDPSSLVRKLLGEQNNGK